MTTNIPEADLQKIGAAVATGLKGTIKDLVTTKGKQNTPKRGAGAHRADNRSRLTWARTNACTLCGRYAHTPRDHNIEEPWPENIDQRQKIARKQWRIIMANVQGVDGESVPYKEVAALLGVDTSSWPEFKQKKDWPTFSGQNARACEGLGLETWLPLDKIGTDCLPKDVTSPEDVPTEVLS